VTSYPNNGAQYESNYALNIFLNGIIQRILDVDVEKFKNMKESLITLIYT
jgi:hypothetical protein